MKRPVGFTILALALSWVAIGGVANAIFRPMWELLRFIEMAYAITAIVAAIGLWKMRPWAFKAFLAWSGVVVVTMFAMQFGLYRIAMSAFVGFACFMLAILWLLATYVKQTLIKNVEQGV